MDHFPTIRPFCLSAVFLIAFTPPTWADLAGYVKQPDKEFAWKLKEKKEVAKRHDL